MSHLLLMENCVHHHHHHYHRTILTLSSSPSSPHKPHLRFFTNKATKPLGIGIGGGGGSLCPRRRNMRVIKASAGASHCEFSSLNSPLEPRSMVGKFLSGVLQNHRQLFHVAVGEELKLLADDRDAALARMVIGSASDEALLHRFSFCYHWITR